MYVYAHVHIGTCINTSYYLYTHISNRIYVSTYRILPNYIRYRGGVELNIIAVINQKGGVGKSTTALSVDTGLLLKRFRVLFIDLDAQGNKR